MQSRVLFATCVVVLCFLTLPCFYAKTIAGVLRKFPDLRKIAGIIDGHSMSDIFEGDNITAFLPSNEAVTYYRDLFSDRGILKNLLLYHTISDKVYCRDLGDNTHRRSRTEHYSLLYFNIYKNRELEDVRIVVTLINGARIIQSDIVVHNGIIHIIDKPLLPIGSSKTIVQYDHQPDIRDISFRSTYLVADSPIVPVEDLRAKANSSNHFFTAFAPNDSYTLNIPEYAQNIFYGDPRLMANTIKAHSVPDKVVFLPSDSDLGIPSTLQAMHGMIKLKRMNGKVFIENNDVRAEVILPNIPVANGVIHVINNLLYFKYQNIRQKLESMENTQIVSFRLPLEQRERFEESLYTVFVPSDLAIGKLSVKDQFRILTNQTIFGQMISDLVVPDVITLHVLRLYRHVVTISNITLYVDDANGDVYIENGVMKARIIQSDIGCTNGVIHVIDNIILTSLSNSILETIMEGQGEMSEVSALLDRLEDAKTLLSNPVLSPFTVFLPSTSALNDIDDPLLSKLIEEDIGALRALLMTHIVQGVSWDSSKLPRHASATLNSFGGKQIILTRDGDDIIAIGNHVVTSVIMRDIWCSDGIIHVIDGLLNIPIHNIIREIQTHPSLNYASNVFQELMQDKNVKGDNLKTVFVPNNEAFHKLSRDTVVSMGINDLNKTKWNVYDNDVACEVVSRKLIYMSDAKLVLKSHVIPRQKIFLEELPDLSAIPYSSHNGITQIEKSSTGVTVMNNYVRAHVTEGNIHLTDGVIHVIDGPINLPYQHLDVFLETNTRTRLFYEIIAPYLDELYRKSDAVTFTVFVPEVLTSYPEDVIAKLRTDESLRERVFAGHVLPHISVADVALPIDVTTAFNMTFRLRSDIDANILLTVWNDVIIYPSRHGHRFVDGMVYFVDTMMNFSPLTAREFMHSYQELRWFEAFLEQNPHLMNVTGNDSSLITMFIPSEEALTIELALSLNTSSQDDISEILSRHVLEDQVLTIEAILERQSLHNGQLSALKHNQDFLLKWKTKEIRVVRKNIAVWNGIVHIVSDIFSIWPDELLPNVGESTTMETIPEERTVGQSYNSNLSEHVQQSKHTDVSGSQQKYMSNFVMLLVLLSLFVIAKS